MSVKLSKEQCLSLYDSEYRNDLDQICYIHPVTSHEIVKGENKYRNIYNHCKTLDVLPKDEKNARTARIATARNARTATARNARTATARNARTARIATARNARTLSEMEMPLETKIKMWLKDPLYMPSYSKEWKPIKFVYDIDNEYFQLYMEAYNFYRKKGKKAEDIKHLLPKEHVLFEGKIDLLFYFMNHEKYKGSERNMHELMIHILKVFPKLEIKKPALDNQDFNQYEKDIFLGFMYFLAEYIVNYIGYYIHKCFTSNYTEFPNYVKSVKNNLEHLYAIQHFFNMMKLNKHIKTLFLEKGKIGYQLVSEQARKKYPKFIYPHINLYKYTDIVKHFREKPDFIATIIDLYEELYNIFNYQTAPEKSPFANLDSKPLTVIPDPLIAVFNNLNKIKRRIKSLNMDSPPNSERSFVNDAQYEKYASRYTSMYETYKDAQERYADQATVLERQGASTSHLQKPENPILKLPNGTSLTIPKDRFPTYTSDRKHQSNKRISKRMNAEQELYKELMDVGILDLLEKAKMQRPAMVQKLLTADLLTADRQYIKEHILRDESDVNINPKKCALNMDVISLDDFAEDDKYFLSKLQLMFRLQTKDKKDKHKIVKTNCFYAPNFYNYVVTKINNNQSIINPATREKISDIDEQMRRLMKIMHVIDPTLETPRFVKPAHDIKLEFVYLEKENLYKIGIKRIIGVFTKTYVIGYIPNDINEHDTQSTNYTSATCLQKIHELFDTGRLLLTYMPPYSVNGRFIKLNIPYDYFSDEFWNDLSETEYVQEFIRLCELLQDY